MSLKRKINISAILRVIVCGVWGLALFAQAETGSADDTDYSKLTGGSLPHMQLVVKRALEASAAPFDADKLRKKLRMSYLLPRLDVRSGVAGSTGYIYGDSNWTETRVYPGKVSPYDSYDATRNDWTVVGQEERPLSYWYVSATWNLMYLIYDRNETGIRYVKDQQSYYNQQVVKNVVRIYKDLKRLLAQRTYSSNEQLDAQITQAAVVLDFLTNDYLTEVVNSFPKVVVLNPAKDQE